jgi:glycosyltransferase involved in cell wall biosynthesis
MPKIRVIVPSYNHARFLRRRIDTILGQTFRDFELILVDDCSRDESCSIRRECSFDPRARLEFNAQNSGSPFKQRNKGVKLARGRHVWIAESDDYAEEHFLERLVAWQAA